MATIYTYELVGKKTVKMEKSNEEVIQCCFTAPDKEFEGLYVEKALVPPEVITLVNDEVLFEVGCKCKIFWERNSYRVAELMVVG